MMTALTCNGTFRYFRRQSRRMRRSGLKGTVLRWCFVALGVWFALNWIYQVVRKPGEILAPPDPTEAAR